MKEINLSDLSISDLVALQTYSSWSLELNINMDRLPELAEQAVRVNEEIIKRIKTINFNK